MPQITGAALRRLVLVSLYSEFVPSVLRLHKVVFSGAAYRWLVK